MTTTTAATRPDDDLGLAGRVAIVTGGGAAGDGIGNGRAACILLARSGTSVLVVDRDEGLAKRTVEMITGEGGKASALSADVTDEAQCAAMVARGGEPLRPARLPDNNVGIGSKGTWWRRSPTPGAGSCRSTSRPCSSPPSTRSRR